MTKRAIPQAPIDPQRGQFDVAIKEILEQITGRRGIATRLDRLPDDATLADVIKKINQIIGVLQ